MSRQSSPRVTRRSGSTLRERALLITCLVVVAVAPARSAHAQSDKFELKPFWTISKEFGSVGLTTDVSRTGDMSLQLASRSGGQRNIWVSHKYPTPLKGTLSVWFYDTAAGAATLYAGLYALDSTNPANYFAVNVADWNGSHYIWNGPGVGETPTSVARTNGWHELKLKVTSTGFDASIDGVLVGSVAGDFRFDTVYLLLSGPVWRPDAKFYFDDFKVQKLK